MYTVHFLCAYLHCVLDFVCFSFIMFRFLSFRVFLYLKDIIFKNLMSDCGANIFLFFKYSILRYQVTVLVGLQVSCTF